MEENNEEKNNKEPEECKKQAEEYLNNWKRERADFINYKKDEGKRMEEFAKFANEDLVSGILGVLDDLETAMKYAPRQLEGKEQVWLKGLGHFLESFAQLLKKYGVERIKVKGESFDPVLHEAVFSGSGESIPEGIYFEGNLDEVRPGYKMHGKVIRPARVKIIK